MLLPRPGHADEPLTLQLNWLPRAQHAGYLMAQAKGHFRAEGLSVILKPGGPAVAPVQVIAAGGADIIIESLPTALAARAAGLPLVNVAQPFAVSGWWLVCRSDSGISGAEPDLRGHTIGVWPNGSEVPLRLWLQSRGISADGGADGVTLLAQDVGIAQLQDKRASCISAMSHDEVIQLAEAGIPDDALVSFRLDGPLLPDGLYVLDHALGDPQMRDRLVRFVRAAMRGWRDVRQNPEAAVDVLQAHGAGMIDEELLSDAQQRRRLDAVLPLLSDEAGRLDDDAFRRAVPASSRSANHAAATGGDAAEAFTHAITDAARN